MKFLQLPSWVALIILFSASAVKAQSPQNILLDVTLVNGGHALNNAVVLVYQQDKLINQYNLKDRDHTVSLETDQYYTIEMQSDGYYSKQIQVNTYVLGELSSNEMAFDVELLSKEVEAENPHTLPVALIRYDRATESLTYDKAYSEYVKQKLALR